MYFRMELGVEVSGARFGSWSLTIGLVLIMLVVGLGRLSLEFPLELGGVYFKFCSECYVVLIGSGRLLCVGIRRWVWILLVDCSSHVIVCIITMQFFLWGGFLRVLLGDPDDRCSLMGGLYVFLYIG